MIVAGPACRRCAHLKGWHETFNAGGAVDPSCAHPGCRCTAFRDVQDERQGEMFG